MPEPSSTSKVKVRYLGHKVTCDSCALLRKSTFARSSSGSRPFVATICLFTREIVPKGHVCTRFRPNARLRRSALDVIVPQKPWAQPSSAPVCPGRDPPCGACKSCMLGAWESEGGAVAP
jgi:hypothetical protein